MTDHVLALDVGGTKIAAGLVDAQGSVLRRSVRPTPAHDAELAWQAVADLVAEVLDGTVPSAVGIGSAGPVDAEAGTVSPININGWQAFPLRDRVRALLPGVPVSLAGDGLCIALGEHWLGAGRGSRFMVGMVVSTGVGGGLVLDGKPFGGRTGNAGHIGHVVAEPDGWPCTCGGRGCVETVAGGPNMVRWAREQGWTGSDAIALAASARAGDSVAAAAFERCGRAVGLSIAAAAAICDLDLAVIGGGISKTDDLLFDPVRRTLKIHAGLSFIKDLKVVKAERDDSGLIGAAALALL
ncbi:ROK family protein [Kutzneria chonburiensis]|uniref:ROK family protein n=1 Tax=Kutzneria chonburiensis TaxID=1483604 RepID=A0ABV6N1T8_9PSEU|nr:ROK family protein [Kutzneria chonburiensis]